MTNGIDKQRLITLVSRGTNNTLDVAQALGIARKSIGNWKTDPYGRVTSRRILDAACRALLRQHWVDRARGREPMHVPEEDIRALVGLE
jgi:hypothetical protein